MKQFEELEIKEQQSREQEERSTTQNKSLLNKKNIMTACICVVVAFLLALLWANIYISFQERKLENMQVESNSLSQKNTITWEVSEPSIVPDNVENNDRVVGNNDGVVSNNDRVESNNEESSSPYKDLEIEFLGAERSSSDYIKIYLKIKNLNDETLTIETKGIYFNGVRVDHAGKRIEGIFGDEETVITITTSFSELLEAQIGDEIEEVVVRYRFKDEKDNIRECRDSGFTYCIGDATVNREGAETE